MIAVSGPVEPREMRVCIDGEPAAFVLECAYEMTRDGEIVCPVGAQVCAAVAVGSCTYAVELRRFTTALADGWSGRRGFEMTVETAEERLRFTGCEWLEIRRRITAGSELTEQVRIAARGMEKEAL